MPKQQVMDHTGHTEHVFDKANAVSLAEAEERFKELTGRGFRPFMRSGPGEEATLIKAFDPTAEETLFIPHLQGG